MTGMLWFVFQSVFCRECKEEFHEGECNSLLSPQGAMAQKVWISQLLIVIPGPARVTFVKWVLIIILSKSNYVHAQLLQPSSELSNWLCGGFQSLIDRGAEFCQEHTRFCHQLIKKMPSQWASRVVSIQCEHFWKALYHLAAFQLIFSAPVRKSCEFGLNNRVLYSLCRKYYW